MKCEDRRMELAQDRVLLQDFVFAVWNLWSLLSEH
jgi:hypothetical protein